MEIEVEVKVRVVDRARGLSDISIELEKRRDGILLQEGDVAHSVHMMLREHEKSIENMLAAETGFDGDGERIDELFCECSLFSYQDRQGNTMNTGCSDKASGGNTFAFQHELLLQGLLIEAGVENLTVQKKIGNDAFSLGSALQHAHPYSFRDQVRSAIYKHRANQNKPDSGESDPDVAAGEASE